MKSLVVARGASQNEILALSLPEIGIALFGIGGLVAVELGVHRVNWGSAGTWGWIIMLGAMGIAGITLLIWW